MSGRCRSSKSLLHVHCESCYSRGCRTRIEVSVSCAVIPCRLHCGAIFHLCKEEEHLLLCPNVRVPCLNADYGCRNHMARSLRATHLLVCPASVVSCPAEWLRWPSDDTCQHNTAALQANVQTEYKEQRVEAVDLAMALVDQRELYARLKMKPLYPELMEEDDEENEEKVQSMGESADEGSSAALVSMENGSISQNGVGGEATGNIDINIEKYNRYEKMFSMEKGGCAVAQAKLDKPNPGDTGGRRKSEGTETAADGQCPVPGLAPWQDGVMDRLGKALTPQEFNMYLVHHGRMLITFGQIAACTPRDKDFVYGSLEPIPVQSCLQSFKIPDSYHYNRKVHQYDSIARVLSEARGVDTSDLGSEEEDWHSNEAEATLLGYAEREVMGHKISDSKGTDGLFVETGTQTLSFRTAPFKQTTTLAEVMVERPLKLRLQLQAGTVTGRHNKGSSVFRFFCGHVFHRRDFPRHFRNVHSDIQPGLNGWFEERCPLAYLGCTYSQRRFQPSTHKATVTYNQDLRCFNLRPTIRASQGERCQQPQRSSEEGCRTTDQKRRGEREAGGGEHLFNALPHEVLRHIASFLDSLSLSQLALVSQLMRDVCSSLLRDRGMVTLHWYKKTYSHGGTKWKANTMWEFSHLFSPVDSWHFSETPSMSAHLKVCSYYEKSPGSKSVPLPGMSDNQEGSQEIQRLVTQFKGNR